MPQLVLNSNYELPQDIHWFFLFSSSGKYSSKHAAEYLNGYADDYSGSGADDDDNVDENNADDDHSIKSMVLTCKGSPKKRSDKMVAPCPLSVTKMQFLPAMVDNRVNICPCFKLSLPMDDS